MHTPEGQSEKSVEQLRAKAAEEKLQFPILVDNDRANWNAWGTGIWPSVYLIDKEGYVRYWWYGELQWQGTDGEQIMRRCIEQLLGDSSSTTGG